MNTYLANIDRQSQKCFERLIKDMKQAQQAEQYLKEENILEWLQILNKMCAYVEIR